MYKIKKIKDFDTKFKVVINTHINQDTLQHRHNSLHLPPCNMNLLRRILLTQHLFIISHRNIIILRICSSLKVIHLLRIVTCMKHINQQPIMPLHRHPRIMHHIQITARCQVIIFFNLPMLDRLLGLFFIVKIYNKFYFVVSYVLYKIYRMYCSVCTKYTGL